MNRYQNITLASATNQAKEFKIGYSNVKYPEIPRAFSDTYVYTNRGDRYDTLALQYYDDASLWWIITRANSNQTPDSLIPNIGSQLRIPGNERISAIIADYETLNGIK
jgi:hypothetical protein|tara:strand:- start:357 stop:680 length:324 start_codon:yes stop_codon:yes gene_type:complete